MLKFCITRLGSGEFDEFNLVELVLTDKTSGISARATCFASETSGVCAILDRQSVVGSISSLCRLVTGTSAVGTDRSPVLVVDVIHIFGKLGKLSCAYHCVFIYR